MRRLILGFAGLLVVAGCRGGDNVKTVAKAFEPLHEGSAAPAYSIVSLAGDTVNIGGPGKPVVLNVWATWCESCREEMEALDSLHKEFGNDARVLGVSVDQGSTEKVKRFSETSGLHFEIAHDPAGDIQTTYQVVGVPTTFVIGKDGKVLWQHTGNIADDFSDVHDAVMRAVR